MKTYCEGTNCKKRDTCAKHQIKNTEPCYEYIDWSTHGGGRCWTDAEGNNQCETWTDCGNNGDYKLYEKVGNMVKTIELAEGKYTIVYDEDGLFPVKCLRYGEEWRDLVGDNLIFYLCAMIEELVEANSQQNKQTKETHNYERFYSSRNDLSAHYR